MNYELIDLKVMGDDRGSLISIESNKNIPFDIKRIYYIFQTKLGVTRGKHAHKKLKQLAVCTSGSCKFLLDDGNKKEIVELSKPDIGLYIGKLIWREMFDFSSDCVLMVIADGYYDEKEYLRNYEDFLKEVNKKN